MCHLSDMPFYHVIIIDRGEEERRKLTSGMVVSVGTDCSLPIESDNAGDN